MTDPNIANTITNYVNAILQNRAQEINKANLPAYQMTQTQLYYNRNLKCFTFVPGVMTVILMLVSAMMTSISITREKNWVLWKYCSSPKPASYSGKVFPYIFLSMINATVIVVLGVLFRNAHRGSLFLLAFEHTFHYNGSFIGNLNYF
jgi:ABC-2 type transport system permease protein